ncbi:MAG: DEAD/DEAH box helicase [Hyphomicrobiaceae bacterium]
MRAPYQLKDFQKKLVEETWAAMIADGRALLIAPTGAGKTFMMADIIQRALAICARRVLVTQCKTHLLDQNIDKLKSLLPDVEFAQIGAGKTSNNVQTAQVIVATPQSLRTARLALLPPVELFVVDEAHGFATPQYQRLLANARAKNPGLLLLGVTATPERADGRGLEASFGSKPAASIDIDSLVDLGELVPVSAQTMNYEAMPKLQEALRGALADHNWENEDLHATNVLNIQVVNSEVVRHHAIKAGERRAVYFCASITHAEGLASAFTAAGIEAVAVSSKTPKVERRRILMSMRAGVGPRVVTNAMLLTEGYDAPPVSAIGLLRAFRSKSTLIQSVGRGLRLSPATDKKDCMVLDFVGALQRHGDLIAGLDIRQRAIGASSGDRFIRDRSEWSLRPEHVVENDEAELIDLNLCSKRTTAMKKVPTSALEAEMLGADRYLSHTPCEKGHLGFRLFPSNKCVTCTEIEKVLSEQTHQRCVALAENLIGKTGTVGDLAIALGVSKRSIYALREMMPVIRSGDFFCLQTAVTQWNDAADPKRRARALNARNPDRRHKTRNQGINVDDANDYFAVLASKFNGQLGNVADMARVLKVAPRSIYTRISKKQLLCIEDKKRFDLGLAIQEWWQSANKSHLLPQIKKSIGGAS